MISLRSRLRQKVLAYFSANPHASSYVHELARQLDVDPKNLHRELTSLERQGWFVSKRRGKEVFYSLDTKNPFLKEFKRLLQKSVGVPAMLTQTFENVPGIELAILYGSFAKGNADAVSDIDVLIVGKVKAECMADALFSLEKRLGREINTVTYSPTDFRRQKLKDPLLRSIFHGAHTVLIG